MNQTANARRTSVIQRSTVSTQRKRELACVRKEPRERLSRLRNAWDVPDVDVCEQKVLQGKEIPRPRSTFGKHVPWRDIVPVNTRLEVPEVAQGSSQGDGRSHRELHEKWQKGEYCRTSPPDPPAAQRLDRAKEKAAARLEAAFLLRRQRDGSAKAVGNSMRQEMLGGRTVISRLLQQDFDGVKGGRKQLGLQPAEKGRDPVRRKKWVQHAPPPPPPP
eukprot:Sspe_Gene.104648::Locus_81385_Transcript_1_1_Confidence_1.000_Length_726::g.104648::m.104648